MLDLTTVLITFLIVLSLIGFVAFFFMRTDVGFYLIVLGSISERLAVEFPIGLRSIQIRPVDVLTVLVGIALVLRLIAGKNRFVWPPAFGLFAAFFIVMPLSLGQSTDIQAGIVTYIHRLAVFTTAIVVYQIAREQEIARVGLKLMYIVAWVTVLLVGIEVVAGIREGLGLVRPSGYLFYEGVYLGSFSVPTILLLLWHPDWERLVNPLARLVLLGFLFIVLLLSLSRVSLYVLVL